MKLPKQVTIWKREEDAMCEINAFFKDNGTETVIMDGVDSAVEEGGSVRLRNIFGEEKLVEGKIISMSMKTHKLIIEKA